MVVVIILNTEAHAPTQMLFAVICLVMSCTDLQDACELVCLAWATDLC